MGNKQMIEQEDQLSELLHPTIQFVSRPRNKRAFMQAILDFGARCLLLLFLPDPSLPSTAMISLGNLSLSKYAFPYSEKSCCSLTLLLKRSLFLVPLHGESMQHGVTTKRMPLHLGLSSGNHGSPSQVHFYYPAISS